MKHLILLLALTLSAEAFAAKEAIVCGENREDGYGAAEIAFVDDTEAAFSFYLKGQELGEEKFGFAYQNEGVMVTVFHEPTGRDRKFQFNDRNKTVQEYLLLENSEKKVGKAKPCIYPAS